jgi:hypothetical protein
MAMDIQVIWFRIKQAPKYLQLWLMQGAAAVSGLVGVTAVVSRLDAVLVRADGTRLNLGLLSPRVITNAGVAFLVDDWDNGATEIADMNYHDSGTGTTAENATDTGLVTPAGPTTRATGTKSQPSANVLRSVGTINYSGTLAITEHGIFSQASRAGGTLWDRSVFSAINVVSGDSIQFTYDCTVTAGG